MNRGLTDDGTVIAGVGDCDWMNVMTEEHDQQRPPLWWMPYVAVFVTVYALSEGPLRFILMKYVPKDGQLYHALARIHWPIEMFMYGIGLDDCWRDYTSWWAHLGM